MWIFTTYGFYSVVCPLKDPNNPRMGIDTNRRMIRARSPRHLENLMEAFPKQFAGESIRYTGTDYHCRVIIDADKFATVLLRLNDQIDYGNFKDACKKMARVGQAYCSFLMNVWSAGLRLQPRDAKKVSTYLDYPEEHAGVGAVEGGLALIDPSDTVADGDDCQDLFDFDNAIEIDDDDYEEYDEEGDWP